MTRVGAMTPDEVAAARWALERIASRSSLASMMHERVLRGQGAIWGPDEIKRIKSIEKDDEMTTPKPHIAVDLTDVRLVEDEEGSHIEPPLDETWDNVTKLRWFALVMGLETGVRVEVSTVQVNCGCHTDTHPTTYVITIHGRDHELFAIGLYDYDAAKTYISGASTGARAARHD